MGNKCIKLNTLPSAVGMTKFGVLIFTFLSTVAVAQRVIPLYPGAIPNSITGTNEETGETDAVVNVAIPTLTIFLPSNENAAKRTAVIICPGGGYGSLVLEREGYTIAKAFSEMGIAAFVLKYRLPNDKRMKNRGSGALQDAQQAIKQIRLMASEFKLDSNKIGMVGFSAGGHLVSSAGTHFNEVLIENKTNISLRPNFMILVYPVISFIDSLVHKGSMNNLLGPLPSTASIMYFSNELQVTRTTPPAFLVHAADDIWVPVGNSIKFFEALQKNGVPAELHIYSKGNHGFLTYPLPEEWMGRCKNWMKANNFIGNE